MKIKVKVIVRAKQPGIEKMPDGSLKVRLKAVPEKGKANEELIEILADYYHISKNQIQVIKGVTSRNKIVVINPTPLF